MNEFSLSIVTYKNEIEELKNLINNIALNNASFKLYIIDNSPTDDLSILKSNKDIIYIHNPSNPGFGSAHNVVIKRAIAEGSKYHFIVNPDIYIENDVITPMLNYMRENQDVGMMMPKILNTDGTLQHLPKLLPSPISIVFRKFKRPQYYYQKFIDKYELRFVAKDEIYNAPILSGCFTLLNLKAIEKVGMYDDAYFMYFEDWDLSRRMHKHYKTIYFPSVAVYHGYESGANKSRKLFKIFVNSAITYFNKWGWFFDTERSKINKKALSQFN